MKKNVKYILFGSGFLILSAILLIVCFVLKPNSNANKINNDSFTLNATDIVLYTGQSSSDFYTVSNKNATITLSSDNEQIYNFENNKLYAVSAGIANITITATLNDKTATTTFVLKIMNESYTYQIVCIDNCEMIDGKIHTYVNFSQIQIYVYDKLKNSVSLSDVSITLTNDAELILEAANFYLVMHTDCKIILSIPSENFYQEIDVIMEF